MPLTINTNIASIQSERALAANRGNMETAMQRLSSGKRINSALDDASGLAVANRMRNQIEGLNMAIRNANDGISLAQTAEGSMEELQNILLRMRELAVQASNGTYTDEDRSYIAAEFDELMKEMRRVSNQAAWDGDVKLIAEGAKPQQVQRLALRLHAALCEAVFQQEGLPGCRARWTLRQGFLVQRG